MAINTATFISDTLKFIRDDLLSNLTDPITTREDRGKFVNTAFPERNVEYPLVIIEKSGMATGPLGAQSEMMEVIMSIECKIFSRSVTQKDQLEQQVEERLRVNQLSGAGTSTEKGLYDFRVLSSVSVLGEGREPVHLQVITVQYKFILGS